MRFKTTGQWQDDFKHDGLLFFAQKTEEMIFYYTSHIYKVPVYNSYFLMKEYLRTSKLVKEKVINEVHLKYILDEFIETFEDDIVFKNNISEDSFKYIIQTLNSSTLQDQERIINYLYNHFFNYYNMCVAYMKMIVREEKEKKKIERAIKCFLPTLLNGGYSQEFIYRYNNNFWANKEISNVDVIDKYFERFDFRKRTYKVYIAISKKAKQFEDILVSRLGANIEQDEYSKKLRYDKDEFVQFNFEVEELDENKAAQRVFENVNLFIRFYKFLGNRREEWFFNKCLVKDEDNNTIVVDIKPRGYSYSEDYDDKTIGFSSETLITALINNKEDSFGIINKVLQIHNKAIENPDMKNGFLNLWSIMEIIGINKRDDSRMSEIENSIVPILANDYAKNIFEELHDYLKANIPEKQYRKIINKVELEEDEYIKIACIVTLDEYSEIRQELNTELLRYPIIRSRIAQLNDLFNKKVGYYNELEYYERRVRWHLRRMYRTRNAIIHSGDNPENLKALGEHLHSYIDEILYEITVQLALNEEHSSIDNVLINSKFIVDDVKKNFKKKEKMQYMDICKLYGMQETLE